MAHDLSSLARATAQRLERVVLAPAEHGDLVLVHPPPDGALVVIWAGWKWTSDVVKCEMEWSSSLHERQIRLGHRAERARWPSSEQRESGQAHRLSQQRSRSIWPLAPRSCSASADELHPTQRALRRLECGAVATSARSLSPDRLLRYLAAARLHPRSVKLSLHVLELTLPQAVHGDLVRRRTRTASVR